MNLAEEPTEAGVQPGAMKIVLLATALLGTLLYFSGLTPFGSGPAADADKYQTSWYRSGQMQSRAEIEHGLRQGPATEWYASGKERCTGEYEGGLREGPWVFYTEAGEIDTARSGSYSAGLRSGS